MVGSIRSCTYCKMELGLTSGPPAAATATEATTQRCALCGLAYDAANHNACPHCTERFGRRRRQALDAHHRGRKATEWLVWIGAAMALTAMGATAHWGAAYVAPTLGAARPLWTWSVLGGLVMGALAGWRLRERSSTAESIFAVVALTIVAAVWLRAALVWANGFNLTGEPHRLPCEVLAREGDHSVVSCAVAGAPVVGEVSDHRATVDEERRVVVDVRRGRLGYWVVASGSLRSLAEEGDETSEGE